MGLGSLKRRISMAIKLWKAWDRLKEASKMRKLKATGYALVSMVVLGIVHSVQAACPALGPGTWGTIVGAGVMAGFALYLARPKTGVGWKATVTGIAASVGTGLALKLDATCPGLLAQLPTLALAGGMTGLGLFLKLKEHDEDDSEDGK